MSEHIQKLEAALNRQFAEDAPYLALLLSPFLKAETMSYEEINLPEDLRDEYILMAYEERLLIPVQERPSYCWEDCGLRIKNGEFYFMPRLSRNLIRQAVSSGKADPEMALKETVSACREEDLETILEFILSIKKHARNFKFEAGLLPAIFSSLNLQEDLHDLVDLFVMMGVISPRKKGSFAEGLAWYEINPCLYWAD